MSNLHKQMLTVLLLFLAIVFSIEIDLSYAQSTVFGPKRFDKPKGHPVTYYESLTAQPGNYALTVQSGQGGLQEAKNVSIRINGLEVMDSSNLRKANPSIKANTP